MKEETRKKISQAKMGKKPSLETRMKMSATRKRLGIKPPSQKGKRHSLNHNQMISKSLTGRKRPPFSEEWRKKMGRSRELNQSKTPNNEYKIARQERIAGRPKPSICEICNNTGRICFDHDHKTGNFRGWICTRCNVILGFVNDDANVLVEIIRYLNK